MVYIQSNPYSSNALCRAAFLRCAVIEYAKITFFDKIEKL